MPRRGTRWTADRRRASGSRARPVVGRGAPGLRGTCRMRSGDGTITIAGAFPCTSTATITGPITNTNTNTNRTEHGHERRASPKTTTPARGGRRAREVGGLLEARRDADVAGLAADLHVDGADAGDGGQRDGAEDRGEAVELRLHHR